MSKRRGSLYLISNRLVIGSLVWCCRSRSSRLPPPRKCRKFADGTIEAANDVGTLRVSFEYIKDTILIVNTLVTVIESTFDGDIVGDFVDNSGLTEAQKLGLSENLSYVSEWLAVI